MQHLKMLDATKRLELEEFRMFQKSPEELAEVYSPGQYVPRRLEFPETRVEMREVSAGEKLCAGIDARGQLWAWGTGSTHLDPILHSSPRRCNKETTTVACGSSHMSAVTLEDKALLSGANWLGQCGLEHKHFIPDFVSCADADESMSGLHTACGSHATIFWNEPSRNQQKFVDVVNEYCINTWQSGLHDLELLIGGVVIPAYQLIMVSFSRLVQRMLAESTGDDGPVRRLQLPEELADHIPALQAIVSWCHTGKMNAAGTDFVVIASNFGASPRKVVETLVIDDLLSWRGYDVMWHSQVKTEELPDVRNWSSVVDVVAADPSFRIVTIATPSGSTGTVPALLLGAICPKYRQVLKERHDSAKSGSGCTVAIPEANEMAVRLFCHIVMTLSVDCFPEPRMTAEMLDVLVLAKRMGSNIVVNHILSLVPSKLSADTVGMVMRTAQVVGIRALYTECFKYVQHHWEQCKEREDIPGHIRSVLRLGPSYKLLWMI